MIEYSFFFPADLPTFWEADFGRFERQIFAPKARKKVDLGGTAVTVSVAGCFPTKISDWAQEVRKSIKNHLKMFLIVLENLLMSMQYCFLMDFYSGWSHNSSWAPRYSIFNIFIEIIIINGNGDTNSYQVPQREFLQKVDFLRAVTPKMFGNGISAFTLPK